MEHLPEIPAPGSTQPKETQNVNPPREVLRKTPVRFLGTTNEFFAIWIVNLLLTIATLGVYSAWAKVRTERYFYGNTEIDGHRFSYLAKPMQILRGRIIAVVLFGAYFLASYISPGAGIAVVIVLFLLSPVLVLLSYRFSLRMTAYRNVRFNFRGRLGRAYVVFLLWPIASVFTLYILLPLALKKVDEFLLAEAGYGDRPFRPRLGTGEYFATGIAAAGIAFLILLVGGIAVGVASVILISGEAMMANVITGGTVALYFLTFIIAGSFYTSRIRNHIFGVTELDGIAGFASSLKMWDLIKLRVVNTLAIIFTLGLAIPWAKIRKARLFADATVVDVLAEVDQVMAVDSGDTGAFGEEAAGLFDVDIALG